MLNPTNTFTVSNELFIENLGDGIVILNEKSGEYFALEGISLEIWELITQKNMSFLEIVEYIISVYEIDEKIVYSDVEDFIINLIKNELIEKVNL